MDFPCIAFCFIRCFQIKRQMHQLGMIDDACDTILRIMERLDGNDSLTVNLIREIVTNLKGGENVHSD